MENKPKPKNTNIILYSTPESDIRIEVFFKDETVWLTQKKIAELFDVDRTVVTKHFRNIFKSGELEKRSVCAKFARTAEDGKTYKTFFYNLNAIIAIGYRVNSRKATQFRIWATKTLKEFIIKGFVLDDNRLKQGKDWGQDYFDELLERIRDIRASERRFYQKITDIYAQCSTDYDPKSKITERFYATVQNKLHFAITDRTAAEIIHSRADSAKPNMGLTTWKYAPKGRIYKSDITIAKNYLNEKEIKSLNRIVSMYLDYAEEMAENSRAMTMENWVKVLNGFLKFTKKEILTDAGSISEKVAKGLAKKEYSKYKKIQDRKTISDFDKQVRRYLK